MHHARECRRRWARIAGLGLAVALMSTHEPGTCVAGAVPTDSTAAAHESTAATDPPPAAGGLAPPRVGGYVQVRESAQERNGLTSALNRARVSIDGGLPARLTYRLLVELEASAGARNPSTVSLREAIVRWNAAPFSATVGEFKTPFSLEYLVPVPLLETADLATVVDSLAPRYDIGGMAEYAFREIATVSAGLFNGEGLNASANRDSLIMAVGRLTVTPAPQLALGASASRDGPDSLRWGIEASIQERGAVVRGEYVTRHRRGRDRGQDDFGWYVFGSYRVTPRVQLVARREDFQRPWLGGAQRVRGATLGANVEIAPGRVRLLVEGLRRVSGLQQRRSDSLLAQLQARF
jgi:hypothetical protein